MAAKSISKQVLLDGVQMSLIALIAGTLSFLKKRHIATNDWIQYIGDQFDSSLADLEGEEVGSVMEHLVTLQVLPMGAKVISSKATSKKAEVKVTPLPSRELLEKFGTTPEELLEGFGVSMKEFASIYAMYEPAAKAIGLRFQHQLKGDEELLILEQADA